MCDLKYFRLFSVSSSSLNRVANKATFRLLRSELH